MTQDLTKITTPFGLLDVETQKALKAAFINGHTIQNFITPGEWNDINYEPIWSIISTYRVKPAPVTVSKWSNVYSRGVGGSYDSRKAADSAADSAVSIKRLAVLRIDITDGEVTFHKEGI